MTFKLNRGYYIKSKRFRKSLLRNAGLLALLLIGMIAMGDRIDDVSLALPVVVVIFWTVVDVLRKPKSFTLQEGTLCAAQYVEKYYPHNIQVNNRRSHTVCVQAEATAIVLVEYCRHDSAVTGGASLGDLHVWGHVVLRDRTGRELDTELLAQPFEAMELYGVEDLEGALAALRAAYPYAVITDMTARS
jgi:hypothetical protein